MPLPPESSDGYCGRCRRLVAVDDDGVITFHKTYKGSSTMECSGTGVKEQEVPEPVPDPEIRRRDTRGRFI